MIVVTDHAVQRYRERVSDIPTPQIIDRLSNWRMRCAVRFGCGSVILPQGNRAVLKGAYVVTVLSKPDKRKRRK